MGMGVWDGVGRGAVSFSEAFKLQKHTCRGVEVQGPQK